MLSRTRIAIVGLAIGLVLGFSWLASPRIEEEVQAGVKECTRTQLDLREGVLYAKGESEPFAGTLVERFPGGAKRIAIQIRAGKAHGLSRGWYENGQIETEEHFLNGASHGLRTRWYENGARKSEAQIVAGKIEGTFTRWHENGQKAAMASMVDGIPNGLSVAWHPSGKIKARAVMKMGEVVEREYFDHRGEPLAPQTGS